MPSRDEPIIKRIVCLANSRKHSGRCIAGLEWDDGEVGGWVRPVGGREGEGISEEDRRYRDGTDPCPLDVIDVPVKGPKPCGHQTENHLLDPGVYWQRQGALFPDDLEGFPVARGPLWTNGDSTCGGCNDQVPLGDLAAIRNSLKLVRVEAIFFKVLVPRAAFGQTKRRVQGRFVHAGETYWLWVTDPLIEREFLARSDGLYPDGPAFLTVSLGEPFHDHSQKLVAAVIRRGEG